MKLLLAIVSAFAIWLVIDWIVGKFVAFEESTKRLFRNKKD